MQNNNLNLTESQTQAKSILRYLENGGKITPIEALTKFGCMRLGARIWDLRQDGKPIEKNTVLRNGKHVAQYYLAKQKEAQ